MEHTDSDLWTVHDYTDSGEELLARYGSVAAVTALVADPGPTTRRTLANGRPLRLPGGSDRGQPVVLSEFGGVRFTPGSSAPEGATWG